MPDIPTIAEERALVGLALRRFKQDNPAYANEPLDAFGISHPESDEPYIAVHMDDTPLAIYQIAREGTVPKLGRRLADVPRWVADA